MDPMVKLKPWQGRALFAVLFVLAFAGGRERGRRMVKSPPAPERGIQLIDHRTGASTWLDPLLATNITPFFFADLSNTTPASCTGIASCPQGREVRTLDGYATTNDGGGGTFAWLATSTKTPDLCTFVRPGGFSIGGWQRIETTGNPGGNRIEAPWCGGLPNANYQNPANGNWYVDSGYGIPARDTALTLRRARAAVVLLGGGAVHIPCGNWLLLTADPAATQNEYITLASNVSWFGDGDCSALRIPGGVTTGSAGYAAIFGINPSTAVAAPSTWAVNNVRVSRLLFDHNSAFNQWGGANFNGIGAQSQTASVGVPVGDNVEIDSNTVENFNGTFVFVGGTYQFQNLATRFKIHDNHILHVADDPNMGDSSFIAAGFTRGSIDHNRIEMGPNVGCGIASIASNAGAMKVATNCAHGLASTSGGGVFDTVVIKGAAAASNANGGWSITVNDSTHFTLTGSAFAATSTTGTVDACRGATAIEAHCIDADISDNQVQGSSVGLNIYADSANAGPMRILRNYLDEVQGGMVVAAITTRTLAGITVGENTTLNRPGSSATGAEWGISLATDSGSYTGSLLTDSLFRGNYQRLAYGAAFNAGNSYGITGGGNLTRVTIGPGNTSVGYGTGGFRLTEFVGANTANFETDVHIVGNEAHNVRLYGVELDGFANTAPHSLRTIVSGNRATQDNGGTALVQSVFVGQQLDALSIVTGNLESNSSGQAQPGAAGTVVLWLEAKYGTSSSLLQSAWNDQSASGFNFAQATIAQQPFLPVPGTGAPEIRFTGTQALTSSAAVAAGAWTVGLSFRLFSTPAPSTGYGLFTFETGASTFGMITLQNNGGYQPYSFIAKVGSTAVASSGFATALDTNLHNLVVTYNNGTNTTPGSYTAILDGTTETVVASGNIGRTITDFGSIGGNVTSGNVVSSGASVGIRKILVYNSALSGAPLTTLEQILGAP